MSERSSAPDWVADAVFYQVFPDRFANGDASNDPPGTQPWGAPPTREGFQGGDLQGVIDHLGHIGDLGATAIYLNPVFTAGTNHRYDTWDYLEVDPGLGGTAALGRLVDAAHCLGMRVILDGVFNHCGDGFGSFRDVVKRGAQSAYADWFDIRSWPVSRDPVNYMTCGGAPYLPKLNTRNPEVREHILRVGRHWVERLDVDGWRLDVPFKVPFDLWREFRDVVRRAKPDAYLVGEVWRDPVPWVAGDMFDGTTNYRLRDLVLDYVADEVLDGEDMGWELGQLLGACGPAATAMLNLLGSHDTVRILTRLGGDVDRLRIALTLLFTLPGAPMVYYGDEVGLLGEADPDCRRAMPWGRASWDELVLGMHRRLIGLRHGHVACRRGDLDVLAAFEGVLAYRRAWDGDEVAVVLNPRGAIADLAVPVGGPTRAWLEVFTGEEWRTTDGVLRLPQVAGRSAAVFIPLG